LRVAKVVRNLRPDCRAGDTGLTDLRVGSVADHQNGVQIDRLANLDRQAVDLDDVAGGNLILAPAGLDDRVHALPPSYGREPPGLTTKGRRPTSSRPSACWSFPLVRPPTRPARPPSTRRRVIVDKMMALHEYSKRHG